MKSTGTLAQKVYHLLGDAGFDPAEFNASYNHASLSSHEKKVADEAEAKELTHRDRQLVTMCIIPEMDSCDKMYNKGYQSDPNAIPWTRMWDRIDNKLGLRRMDDVTGKSTHEHFAKIMEYNWFCGRNMDKMKDGSPEYFTLDQWNKIAPVDMPPLMKQFNDEFSELSNKKDWFGNSRTYRNFWHAVLKGPFNGWRKDSPAIWNEEWFDLEKWHPAFWGHVAVLDRITKKHPARHSGGVHFVVWW
ncbi:hypothetical protein NVP1031O_079 [Vibrio phage 1.031.O._10N.261.46.F8]|nr:hypothetical protein NVP1031O_079 [Vibrio phage 1.031.O._10N.261.46.F8]